MSVHTVEYIQQMPIMNETRMLQKVQCALLMHYNCKVRLYMSKVFNVSNIFCRSTTLSKHVLKLGVTQCLRFMLNVWLCTCYTFLYYYYYYYQQTMQCKAYIYNAVKVSRWPVIAECSKILAQWVDSDALNKALVLSKHPQLVTYISSKVNATLPLNTIMIATVIAI